jgi:integrase
LTATKSITVTELVASYWDWARGYYVKNGRPSGHLPKVRQALRVLRELYGSTSAASIGPLAMRAIQGHCVAAGMSRVYVNDTCGDIRRVFKWAVSHELLPATSYQALTTVPGLKRGRSAARETDPVLPVDDAVVAATLPHLSPVVADMVRFQSLVGCRPTEACLIRPGDLDKTSEVWVYTPSEHKTEHHGRERRIFIGPRAQDVLRPYLLRSADACCFSPVDSERKRQAEKRARRKSKVQPSQLDRSKANPIKQPRDRYTKDSYNRAIRRACIKAGVTPWSPNQLRHAVASAIRRSYGIEAAQTVLGHSRADVTQVYAERDWQKAADVMRAIG